MSKTNIRVYVAGKYSAGNVIDVFENMRRGMQIGAEVLKAGFAPFVPWMDYHFTLMRPKGKPITIEDYYRYSMAWLEASDCVLVISGEKSSSGVKAELKRAAELLIPVFRTIDEIQAYYYNGREKSPAEKIKKEYGFGVPAKRYEDPYDPIREKHWEYMKDSSVADTWYCRKHGEEFVITHEFCPHCVFEVEGGSKARDNLIEPDDFEFDASFSPEKELAKGYVDTVDDFEEDDFEEVDHRDEQAFLDDVPHEQHTHTEDKEPSTLDRPVGVWQDDTHYFDSEKGEWVLKK